MPMLSDSWYLTRVDLDLANKVIHELQAHEGDYEGRGIDLFVFQDGVKANLTGMEVYLEWSHPKGKGFSKFEVVNEKEGHYKIYYPTQMQVAGCVTARIVIVDPRNPMTGSLNFSIDVEKGIIDDEYAESNDDFSVFQKAVKDLHLSTAEAQAAEEQRVKAEEARVKAEKERVTEFGQLKSDSQSATSAANKAAQDTTATNEAVKAAEQARVTAEASRVQAELERVTAEAARVAAELERVSAELERETQQAKNNADQALNNENAAKSQPYICQTGEYDTNERKPTISDPVPGRLYLVPTGMGGDDKYSEWLYANGSWEKLGTTGGESYSVVTTNEIDQAFEGTAQGDSLLSLTGLNYFWIKAKAWINNTFRKTADLIKTSDIENKAVTQDKLSDAFVKRVSDVENVIMDQIHIERQSFTYSLQPSGTTGHSETYQVEPNVVPGYTPVFLAGVSTGNAAVLILRMEYFQGMARVGLRSMASSAVSYSAYVDIAYVKNSLMSS